MVQILMHIFLQLIPLLTSHVLSDEKAAITIDVVEEVTNGFAEITSEELSWHVAILRQTEEGLVFLCSGTLVGGGFVLTSAICAVPIPTNELQVLISQENLHNLPLQQSREQDDIYGVTKKYYRYHPFGEILETDLTVLKLKTCSTNTAPQLTTLLSTVDVSKHCFALGWGVQLEMDQLSNRCQRPSFQDVFIVPIKYSKEDENSVNSILSMKNILGLSSSFILKVYQMLNFHSDTQHEPFTARILHEEMCQANEAAHRNRVYLSVKHQNDCLEPDRNQMCLISKRHDHMASQIDIGSPVFCGIKNGKKQNMVSGTIIREYILAGIVTKKHLDGTPVHKHISSYGFTKATSLENFPEFLFALDNVDEN